MERFGYCLIGKRASWDLPKIIMGPWPFPYFVCYHLLAMCIMKVGCIRLQFTSLNGSGTILIPPLGIGVEIGRGPWPSIVLKTLFFSCKWWPLIFVVHIVILLTGFFLPHLPKVDRGHHVLTILVNEESVLRLLYSFLFFW